MKNEETEIIEEMLFAESLFGFKTRKGLVKLSHGITFEIQISPAEARAFAFSILEAAEAAETDELLATWVEKRVGVKDDAAKAALLMDFREIRDKIRRDEEIPDRKK